jgi:flagellar motor switch protein FliN/FliY
MADEIESLDGLDETKFASIPIEITISIGMARPPIKDLLSLEEDSVLPLNSVLDDPVELYVGEKLIARGLLEEMDEGSGRLGVRVIEVASSEKP